MTCWWRGCIGHHASLVLQVLSAEWTSYVKEPAAAHAYSFSPGYMVAADGSPALHAEWSSMLEAHLYCDAEPRCSGFSFTKGAAVGAAPSPQRAWVSFWGVGPHREVFVDGQVSHGSATERLLGSSLERLPRGSTPVLGTLVCSVARGGHRDFSEWRDIEPRPNSR